MPDIVVAERRIFISQVGSRFLERPVLVEIGQRYWLEDDGATLVVEGSEGQSKRYSLAFKAGPDAPR